MANHTSEGPANVNVVVNAFLSISILAVNPGNNVCVPVEKTCANKENVVVKKKMSSIFFM